MLELVCVCVCVCGMRFPCLSVYTRVGKWGHLHILTFTQTQECRWMKFTYTYRLANSRTSACVYDLQLLETAQHTGEGGTCRRQTHPRLVIAWPRCSLLLGVCNTRPTPALQCGFSVWLPCRRSCRSFHRCLPRRQICLPRRCRRLPSRQLRLPRRCQPWIRKQKQN